MYVHLLHICSEFPDQGFTRPKVLVLLPVREAAYRTVTTLISLLLSEGEVGKHLESLTFLVFNPDSLCYCLAAPCGYVGPSHTQTEVRAGLHRPAGVYSPKETKARCGP